MSGTRWEMDNDALSNLAKKTGSNTQDLGGLVKRLVSSAEPLEGRLSGPNLNSFKVFKSRVDQIAADLNAGLASIAKGQAGMDAAVQTGQSEMVQAAKKYEGGANFDAAKFRKG